MLFSQLSQSPFSMIEPLLSIFHMPNPSQFNQTPQLPNAQTMPIFLLFTSMSTQTVWTKTSITKTQMWGLGLRHETPKFLIQLFSLCSTRNRDLECSIRTRKSIYCVLDFGFSCLFSYYTPYDFFHLYMTVA